MQAVTGHRAKVPGRWFPGGWCPRLPWRIDAGQTATVTDLEGAPAVPDDVSSRDKDFLDRQRVATALAEKLYDHAVGPKHIDPGPTVVTIEGPWGCGKSTLMDLVRKGMPEPPRSTATPRRLTVRSASRLLKDGPPEEPPVIPSRRSRGVVTAWFNPWAHQSGEQVWAGLVAEIIEAAQPVLYPTENGREHYWFTRNLNRVDRYALRRTLYRRTLSRELTLGALGVVASMAIAIAELESTVGIAGHRVQTALIALLLSASFLLLGTVHTLWRYLRGAAGRFLPGELFHGPVSSTVAPDSDPGDPVRAEGLTDPLRRARAGSLYLHQHDVNGLMSDLDREGYELVVFVDDLDRCRAQTTAEVFEAINLFLAGFVSERRRTGLESAGDPGGSLRARFVIGLDPVVVAGHLDRVYDDLYPSAARGGATPATGPDADDPSPGWAFLRKLVHLPVLVPQASEVDLLHFVDQVANAYIGNLDTEGTGSEGSDTEGTGTEGTGSEGTGSEGTGSAVAADGAVAVDGVGVGAARVDQPEPTRPALDPPRSGAATWLRIKDPGVRELIRERLAAQPDLSVREAMRQLNLCDLYARVLAATEAADGASSVTGDDAEAQAVARTRHLIILAEIVSRWPSLQGFLHRREAGRSWLQRLAGAADDDERWAAAVRRLPADPAARTPALAELRVLLRDYDGPTVADLAALLL
jgi:hypothetical protein